MTKKELTQSIKDFARQVGFDLVGIAPPELPLYYQEVLEEWIKAGYSSLVPYIERNGIKRTSAHTVMPDAKSVICLAINYYYEALQMDIDDICVGRISRYAYGEDYHIVVKEKLEKLCEGMRNIAGEKVRCIPFVDTSPLLEKAFCHEAGLGFIGKKLHVLIYTIRSQTIRIISLRRANKRERVYYETQFSQN